MNDGLTRRLDRTAFHEHLRRAIASIKRRSTNLFAIIFIDLDHFKEINATFGRGVGDRVLEVTARRFERCMRSDDIVARLGGDQFAILLSGINGLADANDAVNRIGREMAQPSVVDGQAIRITASMGIALANAHYDTPEEILRDADTAMYDAKAGGRARSVVFTPTTALRPVTDIDLQADLRHAIERGELRVEYQPIVHLAGRSIVGFEALVRWQHPRRGLLQPSGFIPKAEETDLIIGIDRWVLFEACRQLREWEIEQPSGALLQMSVNFSSKQFSRADLLEHLRGVLDRTNVAPSRLRLEITESAIMERSERTASLLAAIRALGIELHIDDFGTGFSSLAALQHMPVNALKIDRSFVTSMHSPSGSELVRTIATLAHNLGMAAIAEGVETREQAGRLDALQCDFAQGFYFSEPLDARAAGKLVAAAGNDAT